MYTVRCFAPDCMFYALYHTSAIIIIFQTIPMQSSLAHACMHYALVAMAVDFILCGYDSVGCRLAYNVIWCL